MKKVLLLAFIAAMSVTSCTDKEATLSKTHYTLYHSTKERIQGTDVENIGWSSNNEFVATIADGIIEGQYVGNTRVESTEGGLVFSVDVRPRHHLYDEPDMDWGASKSTIISRHGQPYSSSSESLTYKSNNPQAPYYVYMFNNTGLYGIGVAVLVSAASELADFLLERYVVYSVNMNTYTASFAHCYGKVKDPKIDYAVGMQYSSSIGGIIVAYIKGNTSKSDIKGVIEDVLIESDVNL